MKIFALTANWPRLLKYSKLATAAFVLTLTVGSAALADPPRRNEGPPRGWDNKQMRHDRDWQDHQGRANRYWRTPRYTRQPDVIYAPPLVYAPQPYYQQPMFNFVIPLNIH